MSQLNLPFGIVTEAESRKLIAPLAKAIRDAIYSVPGRYRQHLEADPALGKVVGPRARAAICYDLRWEALEEVFGNAGIKVERGSYTSALINDLIELRSTRLRGAGFPASRKLNGKLRDKQMMLPNQRPKTVVVVGPRTDPTGLDTRDVLMVCMLEDELAWRYSLDVATFLNKSKPPEPPKPDSEPKTESRKTGTKIRAKRRPKMEDESTTQEENVGG